VAYITYKGTVGFRELHAEAPATSDPEVVFEERKKRKGPTKEDNRDAISSQHRQVKDSLENPGVYAWGSNAGKVVAPDLNEPNAKNPRRIAFFDGKLLRDLKLDKGFGAAIDDKGDLYQWGKEYSAEGNEPTRTLQGKNLKTLAISQDRVFALSSGGDVYSVPVSREDQLVGVKPQESSWIPFMSGSAQIAYRKISIPDMAWSERVTAVSSGLEHGLLLTSTGRVFSFASSSTSYPSRGQLGIPGIAGWETRPSGPYDQPHQLQTLKGFPITAMAVGDHHSLVLDNSGRVFAFGDNSSGQLGIDVTPDSPYVDVPALLPTSKLYAGSSQTPVVTSVAAGGSNSFLTVDATRVASANDDMSKPGARALVGRVTADTWACGQGIMGTLGTGRWTHVQGVPVKIKALSGLFEWDEEKETVIPIRLGHLAVGSSHVAATMANVTYLGATGHTSENDTNWGADVVWWGGNQEYQLGTGKRANVNAPTYIGSLDKLPGGEKREDHRLHITPRTKARIGGRMVEMEQRVECGRMCSAVYSRILD